MSSRSSASFVGTLLLAALLGMGGPARSEEPPSQAARSGTAEQQKQRRERLTAAAAKIPAGQLTEALAQFDALIAEYQADVREPGQLVFCASTQTETLLYLLQASGRKQNAVVLDDTWSSAHYLRGYVLIDLRRSADAREALQQAVNLSPNNAQYLSELAQLLARTGQAEQALQMFKQAQSSAEFSPPQRQSHDTARALRGQGFALIELKLYDEAEKAYREALALEPGNALTKSQLQVIATKRTSPSTQISIDTRGAGGSDGTPVKP